MTLQRTLVASCDAAANDCDGQVDLNPDSSQPWYELLKLGWSVNSALGQTYCPNHAQEATT